MVIYRVFNEFGYIEFASHAEAIAYASANNLGEPIEVEKEMDQPIATEDWQGFMDSLDVPPIGNGLFQRLIEINLPLALHSYQLCLDFLRGHATEKERRTLNWIYNEFVRSLSEEQIELLRQSISEFNIELNCAIYETEN